MKSNQERSNECLPPKKREIPVTSLPSEEKTAAPASESQRVDHVRWSPSIPSSQSSVGARHSNTATLLETGLQQGIVLHKSLSTAADYSSPSAPRSTSAMQSSVYAPALSQSGTTLSPAHYTHLQHPFQFAQYGAPFAAIVPSQLVSPTANSTSGAVTSTSASATATTLSQRSQLEAYSTMLTSMGNVTQQSHKVEQHLGRAPGLVTAGSPTATSPAPQNQFVRVSSSPQSISRTVSSPASQLHPHSAVIPHNLTSQVILQYADSGNHCFTRESHKKAEDSRLQVKEILNGEIEKSRRYGISPSTGTNLKTGNKAAPHHYEARHLVVHPSPSDYSAHNSSGVRTSLMVVPNSNSFAADLEVHHAIKRNTSPSAVHEKVGTSLGKLGSRPYALSPQQTLGHEGVKTIANLSPHTVIQTAHNASEHLPVGLSPTAFYTSPQHPVIGYLSSQQSAVGYHGNLSHLVIPGAQPFLIPLSSADVEASGVTSAIVTSSPHYAAVPHAFVSTAIPKTENFSHEAVATQPAYQAAVLQAQIHLPVAQPASSPTAASPALPPYFMKGSIIQLANGELKKVEDLKTEDFIQSAEISNELKIDSSTVERIEESHNPGFAVIQFAVGEHRTQVVVEVVIEYPFFVFGQGWSSCCPERTSQLFDLPCCKLSVGDVCISLTLKNLKNGSVKKGQPMDSAGVLLKHPKNDGMSGSRPKYVEQDNGIKQGNTEIVSENGELKFPEKTLLSSGSLLSKTESRKPTATRKRRWSAPETRRVEKTEEEPPLTLPKPSFIPQEVKICIEGRSNVGK